MARNIAMLEKIYDHISAEPEEWRQVAWVTINEVMASTQDLPTAKELGLKVRFDFQTNHRVVKEPNLCGTAFCVAGHAVNMDRVAWFLIGEDGEADEFWDPNTGQSYDISDAAQKILGLSWKEAEKLFAADNSLETIRAIIDDLTRKECEGL